MPADFQWPPPAFLHEASQTALTVLEDAAVAVLAAVVTTAAAAGAASLDTLSTLLGLCETGERAAHAVPGAGTTILSASPLDFFRYFNAPDYPAGEALNCSVHVDPGFVTIVPCALVPGLAVQHPGIDGHWHRVEKPEVAGATPLQDCAVLINAGLAAAVGGFVPASVHRVDRDAQHRPRLSLVYELRPRVQARRQVTDGRRFTDGSA